MKVGIYSRKGGVGKSSLAMSLSYYLDSAIILTNDSAGRFHKYENYHLVDKPSEYDYDGDLIYDFGGFLDADVLEVLSKCDVVIIPTDDDESGLQELLDAVEQVELHHENIILVHNKYEIGEDTPEAVVQDNFGSKYPLFKVRNSKTIRKALYSTDKAPAIHKRDNQSLWVYRNINSDLDTLAEAVKIVGGA